MTKILINANFGGYELSEKAMQRYAELKGISLYANRRDAMHPLLHASRKNRRQLFSGSDIERNDPLLIQVFEELGQLAGNDCKLKIVEIPDDVEWQIEEYDGMEWVAEKHRVWR